MNEITANISAQVGVLQRAIQRLGAEQPSFENGIPAALVDDLEAYEARQSILALTDKLHALLSDPEQLLGSHTNPAISSNAICQLGLVKTLPIDSPGKQVEDIAHEANVPANLVKRLFKHAATHHVYAETAPGFFSHTAASKLLASDPDCQKWLRVGNDHIMPASFKIAQATQKWSSSSEPNHCGWNLSSSSPDPIFQTFETNPSQASTFSGAMRFFSKHPGFSLDHLLSHGPDWHAFLSSGHPKTLTDIGGSTGHASLFLASHLPGLHCVVQDREKVIAQVLADESRAKAAAEEEGRVKFEAHDMFLPQKGKSDGFLLRMILHDWSEKYAEEILKGLIPGMKMGTKVWVQDVLLPTFGAEVSNYRERMGRAFDLNMLGLQNGQERDLDDWRSLIAQVSDRFKLTGVYQHHSSILSVIEFTWT